MTAKYVLLAALLLGAGCAPPKRPCKTSMPSPAYGTGYELEWTARAPHRALDALCGYPPRDDSLIRFEVAVLRGTGPTHVGAALRRELEPRLLERFQLASRKASEACSCSRPSCRAAWSTCCECDRMPRSVSRTQAAFLVDDVPGLRIARLTVPMTADWYHWECKASAV